LHIKELDPESVFRSKHSTALIPHNLLVIIGKSGTVILIGMPPVNNNANKIINPNTNGKMKVASFHVASLIYHAQTFSNGLVLLTDKRKLGVIYFDGKLDSDKFPITLRIEYLPFAPGILTFAIFGKEDKEKEKENLLIYFVNRRGLLLAAKVSGKSEDFEDENVDDEVIKQQVKEKLTAISLLASNQKKMTEIKENLHKSIGATKQMIEFLRELSKDMKGLKLKGEIQILSLQQQQLSLNFNAPLKFALVIQLTNQTSFQLANFWHVVVQLTSMAGSDCIQTFAFPLGKLGTGQTFKAFLSDDVNLRFINLPFKASLFLLFALEQGSVSIPICEERIDILHFAFAKSESSGLNYSSALHGREFISRMHFLNSLASFLEIENKQRNCVIPPFETRPRQNIVAKIRCSTRKANDNNAKYGNSYWIARLLPLFFKGNEVQRLMNSADQANFLVLGNQKASISVVNPNGNMEDWSELQLVIQINDLPLLIMLKEAVLERLSRIQETSSTPPESLVQHLLEQIKSFKARALKAKDELATLEELFHQL